MNLPAISSIEISTVSVHPDSQHIRLFCHVTASTPMKRQDDKLGRWQIAARIAW
jgi:hypothetical protein